MKYRCSHIWSLGLVKAPSIWTYKRGKMQPLIQFLVSMQDTLDSQSVPEYGCVWLLLAVFTRMCLSVSSVFLYWPVTFSGVRTSWFKTCAPPLGDLNPFGSARSPQRDQTKPTSVPLWEPKYLLVSLFDSRLKGQGWFLCGGGEGPGLSSRASCPLLHKQVSIPSTPCLL